MDAADPALEARLRDLAIAQHGVLSREQVVRAGGTKDAIRWRVSTGRWEVVQPGVWRIAGSRPTWRQAVVAACLAWGPGTVAYRASAGTLWRFPNFPPGPVQVATPRGRRRSGVVGVEVHHVTVLSEDITIVDGVDVTTVERTLIDLAPVCPEGVLEECVDHALRERLTTLPRLRRRVAELSQSGRSGISVIRGIVMDRDPRAPIPESPLETRAWRFFRTSGLPLPVKQYWITDAGRRIARVDFAYPDLKVGIEADSYGFHSGRAHWRRELARVERVGELGWHIVHVTEEDLRQPVKLRERIERAIVDATRRRRG